MNILTANFDKPTDVDFDIFIRRWNLHSELLFVQRFFIDVFFIVIGFFLRVGLIFWFQELIWGFFVGLEGWEEALHVKDFLRFFLEDVPGGDDWGLEEGVVKLLSHGIISSILQGYFGIHFNSGVDGRRFEVILLTAYSLTHKKKLTIKREKGWIELYNEWWGKRKKKNRKKSIKMIIWI